MLVTCPECQGKISDQADPCPHCGFPTAGRYSKESCQATVEHYIKKRGETIIGHQGLCCDVFLGHNPKIVDAKLERQSPGPGYQVTLTLKCPLCDSSTHDARVWK